MEWEISPSRVRDFASTAWLLAGFEERLAVLTI
jgi:hypothetical protein